MVVTPGANLSECLQWARLCSKCFVCIQGLRPHPDPSAPNWAQSTSSTDTQPVSHEAGLQTQVSAKPDLVPLCALALEAHSASHKLPG